MAQLTSFLRQHSIALLALFVALGGTSYAAVSLPRNSVGSAQLRTGAVNSSEIRRGAVKNGELASGAVTASKIRGNSVTTSKVKPGSLLAADFKPGELPRAPTSLPPTGAAGGALNGSYPSPGLADGVVTASKLGKLPSVRVQRSDSQTIPASATATQGVSFPSTPYNNDGLFGVAESGPGGNPPFIPANATVLTIPVTGTYVISAEVRWAANATGTRTLAINGTQPGGQRVSQTVPSAGATQITRQNVSTVERFSAGDYLYASAGQDSGGDLNITGSQNQQHLSATFLTP